MPETLLSLVMVVATASASHAGLDGESLGLVGQAVTGPAVKACALVPKEEVKKHLPWAALLDTMPVEEESIGTAGSSCTYPSVHVQVLPFSQRTLDMVRKKGPVEAVAGIGDEAYFHDNVGRYAELYVKAGQRLITVQGDVDGNMATVKAGVLSLARVLVTKVR